METKTIFFIGKPGSGKGDQARLLAEKTSWPTISSGQLFREIAEEDTPAGHKTKSEMEAGLLAPHWFAQYLFLKTLFSLSGDKSIIFDGFCRKVPEAELVIDALKWIGRPFSLIHLVVSDEEIKHRIELRKDVEGRADDNAVDERLREYRTYTEPAIEKVRESGNLIEINGEGTREEIAENIRKALNLQ
ncbi:MAG: nucleoside monophosphate kinase [Candidatus Paceibacterota bacterium]|jgi:adenylate kinase